MRKVIGLAILGLLLAGSAKAQDGLFFPGSWQASSTTGTTAAINTTLPAVPTQFTYLCGFSIDSSATAATVGNATVALGTVTLNFNQPTNANNANTPVGQTFRTFTPCLRSNTANTAITVTTAAPGAGGVISLSVWGYNR